MDNQHSGKDGAANSSAAGEEEGKKVKKGNAPSKKQQEKKRKRATSKAAITSRNSKSGGESKDKERIADEKQAGAGNPGDTAVAPKADIDTAASNEFEREDDDTALDPEYERYLRGRNEESLQQMRSLLEVMSPDQLSRYETYRSSAFPKSVVKRLMQQYLGQGVPERLAVVAAGVMKLHVGELVEEARESMRDASESGPIRPTYLREAHRRIYLKKTRDSGVL